ncbi:NAD(P)-dependent alcohol dehydrogenase [Conexibacter sp. CPCC 206217]|uniref:NAD(P)-dependent alcohol dehydrogenase n=1 Tax=Conexibacter sp. CPCC 206217 TaxID=3064574 RepID=UPI0027237540|nr:NAD(P)-dependent alcohol dehydrogenase [Conexibacter sp. CPCC 206217]MDO8212380.1 NAD(P)-dependent alcohol dehydrogenase [Conexibacter sp. CPCC 206217]
MALTTPAYSAPSTGVTPQPTTIERRDVGPTDVLIDIRFCGICHTDIHQVNSDWGRGIFPMVPGHEIAGIVAQVGAEVTKFAVGDRVGVGCFVDSCGACEYCRDGEEQFCARGAVATYGGRDYDGKPTKGGYSQQIVVKDRFVVTIPDSLPLADAAPLLCAGITTYTPLKHWNAGPGKQVAIVGMGGLGHVGVQLAKAMGAEVTVISQTLSKREDGLRLGADHYFASSDPATFKTLRNRFDLIVNTVGANIDLDAHLSLLRVDGTLVHVGLPAAPDSLRLGSLIGKRRSMAGSNTGGLRDTQAMLDFCAEHGVAPWIELIGADEIASAYDRVVASKVRYRFVIDAATFSH